MKFSIVFLFVMFGIQSNAQNTYGQIAITAGASHSVLRGVHKIPFKKFENYFNPTAGYQFHLDYAFIKILSFGGGFTRQNHSLSIINYQYESNLNLLTENVIQNIEATSIYLRVLLHSKMIYSNSFNDIDLYYGIMFNQMHYKSTSSSSDPNFYKTPEEPFDVYSAVIGVRYYPIDKVGLFFETAFPGAYTFSGGITLRAFGRYNFIDGLNLNF